VVIKILRSGSPQNLVSYLLGPGHEKKEDRARILTGNFLNTEGTTDDLVKEFSSYLEGSKLKHPCFHVIISLPPGESLTENQAHELIQDVERELKMEDYPYLAVEHLEKDLRHYHIAIGRHSPLQGKILNDPHSYRVLSNLAREEERKWGLRQLSDPFNKSIVRKDKRKIKIRANIIESLSAAKNYNEFVQALQLRGITVIRQRGIAYSDGVIRVKGSDPQINYSLSKVLFALNPAGPSESFSSMKVSNESPGEKNDWNSNTAVESQGSSNILSQILDGAGADINQVSGSASKHPSIDDDDEEYWKRKKRKSRRLF